MGLTEQDQLEDRQESFTFSNCDFSSSSFGVVLSDGEDSDESYIEIELERAGPYRNGDVQTDDKDGEIELRISISSHVPFPRLSIPSFSHAVDAMERGSSQSSSSATNTSASPFSSKARDDNKKGTKSKEIPGGWRGTVQFPAVGRLLSMLVLSLKVPPEICEENNVACSNEKQDKKTEMLRTRKSSSKTRTTMNGGIMKFFIKLRAMQAKSLLAPIMKTRDATATDPKGKKRTSGRERKQKLEETLEFYRRMSTSKSAKNSSSSPSSSATGTNQCYNKSSSVRMNSNGDDRSSISKMNSKKSAAEASNSGWFKRTSSSSCPSSIRCSPLHAGESSIQAAIAHCKSSFAPFPGFYF
ncbi:hypothetical protein NL676_018849 [Syzygium grande]|nr:hypothetical protein NL676_018849 [Syzygium grande]